VLANPQARTIMMLRHNLREAYAQVERKGTRFESALVNAKQEVEVAMGQISGYDPADSTLLEIGRELRDTSGHLFDSMTSIAKKTTSPSTTHRKKKK
jgi:hypothetical protein